MSALAIIGLGLLLLVPVGIGLAWWWIAKHPVDPGDGPTFPDR